MIAHPIRVYVDTSVWGGPFDKEFRESSDLFFSQVRAGRFELVVSSLVRDELEEAPDHVRELLFELLPSAVVVDVPREAISLVDEYIRVGVVTPHWSSDALHVAIATVTGCAAIVSWNFRHIVHFEKISLYNAVNARQGYRGIGIHSPREVIRYDEEEI